MFDKTGASFTFSIVIPKDIGSDERYGILNYEFYIFYVLDINN
mgnify:CR=1 FL=1